MWEQSKDLLSFPGWLWSVFALKDSQTKNAVVDMSLNIWLAGVKMLCECAERSFQFFFKVSHTKDILKPLESPVLL